MKDFLKVWRLLLGAISSLAMAVLIPLLLYMMWTGQDVKNIHVALIVFCAVWSMDSPAESKPKEQGKDVSDG